jgi:hypothetical protein
MQYPVTINYNKLLENLQAEQTRVLMAIKPNANARTAWNRALQAVVDTLPANERPRVKALMLEVTI